MSFKFQYHIPGMCDPLDSPFFIEVADVYELLHQPWIDEWRKDRFLPKFYRYSQIVDNIDDSGISILMVEFDDGKLWYVLGIAYIPDLELPEWNITQESYHALSLRGEKLRLEAKTRRIQKKARSKRGASLS